MTTISLSEMTAGELAALLVLVSRKRIICEHTPEQIANAIEALTGAQEMVNIIATTNKVISEQ